MRRFHAFVLSSFLIACGSADGTGEEALGTPAPRAPAGSLRIMQYNIKHAAYLPNGNGDDGSYAKTHIASVANVIRYQSPDIVTLDEVDVGVSRSGGIDEPAYLSAHTGLPYHVFKASEPLGGGHYGLAILSRYPIKDASELHLTQQGEPRISMLAHVEVGSRVIPIAATQLGLSSTDRQTEASEIISTTLKGDPNVVFTGDFNESPAGKAYAAFEASGLHDVWKMLGHGEGGAAITLPALSARIDFVMTGSAWGASAGDEIHVVQTNASDHYAVVATLAMPYAPPPPPPPATPASAPWDSLGGGATSSPAVASWGAGRLDVFVRGGDDQLWHRWYDAGAWSPGWEPLGGKLTSSPSAVARGPGQLDVVARGADNTVWHKSYGAWGWSGWESIGGVATSSPAIASWGPNRLDVFVRGGDNGLWHRDFEGGWSPKWESIGGTITSDPSAVSWGPNRVDIVARGGDDAVWHKAWTGSAWSGWSSLGGGTTSSPGIASWSSGRLDLFVRGTDDAVWHKSFAGGWSGWESLGGTATSSPAAVSWSPNRIDIVVRGGDDAVWHKAWDGAWY